MWIGYTPKNSGNTAYNASTMLRKESYETGCYASVYTKSTTGVESFNSGTTYYYETAYGIGIYCVISGYAYGNTPYVDPALIIHYGTRDIYESITYRVQLTFQ